MKKTKRASDERKLERRVSESGKSGSSRGPERSEEEVGRLRGSPDGEGRARGRKRS